MLISIYSCQSLNIYIYIIVRVNYPCCPIVRSRTPLALITAQSQPLKCSARLLCPSTRLLCPMVNCWLLHSSCSFIDCQLLRSTALFIYRTALLTRRTAPFTSRTAMFTPSTALSIAQLLNRSIPLRCSINGYLLRSTASSIGSTVAFKHVLLMRGSF